MGIAIKTDLDFSENNLGTLKTWEPTEFVTEENCIYTRRNGGIYVVSSSSSAYGYYYLIALDVSELVGKMIRITSVDSLDTSYERACFASAITDGNTSITTITELVDALSNKTSRTLATTYVERFNVCTTSNVKRTVIKQVPSGSKFLLFNCLTSQLSEALVEVYE